MPYNTTAIPPRKEVTGQTQLPLSRVKKIVDVDPDVGICSNNAAFAITLATELFIQYLSEEALHSAKLERKPRRNIQYKDVANAVLHQGNLEFLEDVVPRTTQYRQVKKEAAAQRAKMQEASTPGASKGAGDAKNGAEGSGKDLPNGKRQKSMVNGFGKGGGGSSQRLSAGSNTTVAAAGDDDPSTQLQMEMRQAQAQTGDDDVDMAGTD